jgi:hypothetical protein
MMIKLSQVYNSMEALNRLSELPIPVTISFKLAKLLKQLTNEIELLEKLRQKLIKQYGKEDETGNFTVLEENKEVFFKEFTDLLNTKITIEFEPISIDLIKNLNLSISDMSRLDYLFKE